MSQRKRDLGLGYYEADTSKLESYNPDFAGLDKTQQGIYDAYNEQRNFLKDKNKTDTEFLSNQWNQFMQRDAEQRLDNNRAFTSGRATIEENAFDRNRQTAMDASARGLGTSGLNQAGMIQDRIETGRQVNDLAGTFVDQQSSLSARYSEAELNMNKAKQDLTDTLTGGLADILSQENATKANYGKMIEDMKRNAQLDQNNVLNAKMEWDRLAVTDKNSNIKTQADWAMQNDQFEQTLKEFEERKAQAARQEQLQRDQMAQAAALQREQMAHQAAMAREQMANQSSIAAANRAYQESQKKNAPVLEKEIQDLKNAGYSLNDINAMIQYQGGGTKQSEYATKLFLQGLRTGGRAG